ncbi:hypothetical protein EOD41_00320 [Mucilaginibacter limnophilus]|uniref:Uncharacterized protein n=1 Tax=Mucilaginibacter limnophilus TaxID=1932778 RepID=A0A437MXN1_9SPHI|nr:hypothetical protein [Mucilaginibacter limnophilus]RVU02420.1 hypothetical protein EOD41_00320 [Mucilaginibacter limnophilus]
MDNKTLEYQAKVYMYDLGNCAKEYGFKTDDLWELSLTTADEKVLMEKKYMPLLSVKALPEMLSELGRVVKEKLIQAKTGIEKQLNPRNIPSSELVYLIAYNPKRTR